MRRLTPEQFMNRARLDANGCLVWQGAVNDDGYALVRWRNRTWLAHRLAWTLSNGPIPTGMQCLHQCDNPPCIKSSHLFLGTHTDNMRDAASKGRNVMQRRPWTNSGERSPSARLTTEDVRSIRFQAALGERRKVIAARFGVSRSHLDDIIARRRWAYV